MEEWKRLVRDTVNTPEKLAAAFDVDLEEMRRIHKEFPDPHQSLLSQSHRRTR